MPRTLQIKWLIITRSPREIWKASPSMVSDTSTLPLLLENLCVSVVSKGRASRTRATTTLSSEQWRLCQVLATHQIIPCSWLECQVSKYPFKRCHSTKTCKSLVRTVKSRDTTLSRFMGSVTEPWTARRQASRTRWTALSVRLAILCFQENRMKQRLWKRDHRPPSALRIRVTVSTPRMGIPTATSSSNKTVRSSRTEPMRTQSCRQQSYLRPRPSNLRSTRRICPVWAASSARRTYLLTVLIMHNSSNQSNLLHRVRLKISLCRKLRRQLTSVLTKSANGKATWSLQLRILSPTWLTPTSFSLISQAHTPVPISPERKQPILNVRTSM